MDVFTKMALSTRLVTCGLMDVNGDVIVNQAISIIVRVGKKIEYMYVIVDWMLD